MFGIFKENRLVDAAEIGDLETVKAEIAKGCDINSRGMFKTTALMMAAANGHLEVVDFLLQQKETDVDAINAGGTTALMTAARGGHIKVVKRILQDKRCDPNKLGGYGGTALMNAAGFGHMDIVKEFLKIDNISLAPTYTDKKHSPISIAKQNGFEEIANLLIEFEKNRNNNNQKLNLKNRPNKRPKM